MTLFQSHCERWRNCQACLLCRSRNRVVLARGKIPAEVLFVGEAPGDSEDVVGKPFVGPAGRLLDYIVNRALDGQHDYAMTNLVCCIPKDSGNSKGEPPKEAILTCKPRLTEFIDICSSKVVIAVGLLAQRHLPAEILTASILHPAAILRMDVSQQSLAIKRCIVTVEDAVAFAEDK